MTRLLCATLALAMMSGLPASNSETYKFDASKLRPLLDKDQSLRSKDRPRLTFSWVSNLQSHINACWQLPKEVTDKTKVAARIVLELNPDGSLKNEPSILEVTKHPLSKAFAESAVAAIKHCAPYAFLPAEEYTGGWDKLDMSFSGDPVATSEFKSGAGYHFDPHEVQKALQQRQQERSTPSDQ